MKPTWPNYTRSINAGCTCTWFSGPSIVAFDPKCPILRLHKGVPDAVYKERYRK